jgi:hypothetical protein
VLFDGKSETTWTSATHSPIPQYVDVAWNYPVLLGSYSVRMPDCSSCSAIFPRAWRLFGTNRSLEHDPISVAADCGAAGQCTLLHEQIDVTMGPRETRVIRLAPTKVARAIFEVTAVDGYADGTTPTTIAELDLYLDNTSFVYHLGQWSACSKPCGGGIRTRSVECRGTHAQNGVMVYPIARCAFEHGTVAANSTCNTVECDLALVDIIDITGLPNGLLVSARPSYDSYVSCTVAGETLSAPKVLVQDCHSDEDCTFSYTDLLAAADFSVSCIAGDGVTSRRDAQTAPPLLVLVAAAQENGIDITVDLTPTRATVTCGVEGGATVTDPECGVPAGALRDGAGCVRLLKK